MSKSRNRIRGLVLALAGPTVLAGWAMDAAAQLLAQAGRTPPIDGGTLPNPTVAPDSPRAGVAPMTPETDGTVPRFVPRPRSFDEVRPSGSIAPDTPDPITDGTTADTAGTGAAGATGNEAADTTEAGTTGTDAADTTGAGTLAGTTGTAGTAGGTTGTAETAGGTTGTAGAGGAGTVRGGATGGTFSGGAR